MSDTFLHRPDGSFIRYVYEKGSKSASILYLHGLLSSFESAKGQAVAAFAARHGFDFLALDYTAHGKSSGAPEDFRVGQCLTDIKDVVHAVLGDEKPLIVVGSSLGGWLALLLAKQFKKRVLGLLGIAAAPDFMPAVWTHILTEENRTFLKAGGILGPDDSTKGYCFSYPMFQDAEQFLVLKEPLLYDGDVVLLQGDQDASVDARVPFKIKERLVSDKIQIHIIKGCDHGFTNWSHLRLVIQALANLCERVIE